MSAAVLTVETADFADASATMYRDVADPIADAVFAVTAALAGSGGMAGNDPGGLAWAERYDRAARSAVIAGVGVANASYQLSAMFAQTARNYEAADAASNAAHRQSVLLALPDPTRVDTGTFPPPAAGLPDVDLPHHWNLVAHVIRHVWPNGHQDRLHHAAAAWDRAAEEIAARAFSASLTAITFPRDRLPETDDVLAVCQAMTSHVHELADTYRSLAASCRELATHIDQAHSEVESELASLAAQSAVVQGVGAIAAVFTMGAAEIPTQGVEATRIYFAAARINTVLVDFLGAAQAAAVTVGSQLARADRIAAEMRGIYGVRLSVAVVDSVRALPRVRQTLEARALLHMAVIGRRDWPRLVGILQVAVREKGNFGLGEATAREADVIGRAWVGDGAKWSQDGTALESRDGLRLYRSPSYKKSDGVWRANLEARREPRGAWRDNGHLEITDRKGES